MLDRLFDNVYPSKSRAFLDGLLGGIVLTLVVKAIYDDYKALDEYEDETGNPVDVVPSTCTTSAA